MIIVINLISTSVLFALAALTFTHETLSLKLLWNMVVPVAPLLFLTATNFWVSICPFAFLQSLPARLGAGGKLRISKKMNTVLSVCGWSLLFVLVPLRHFLFDKLGIAAFSAIMGISLLCVSSGLLFQGLSGWCNTLCPVKPVEYLYGQFSLVSSLPDQCTKCSGCTPSCSRIGKLNWTDEKLLAYTAYMFPGFVAGFFLTNDIESLGRVYAIHGAFMALSFLVFSLLRLLLSHKVALKAAGAVAFIVYYSFAIPAISRNLGLPSGAALLLGAVASGALLIALIADLRRPRARR